MNSIFNYILLILYSFQINNIFKKITTFICSTSIFCFYTLDAIAGQNIVIYQDISQGDEAISSQSLESNLDPRLLLAIALITCVVWIVFLYRQSHKKYLFLQTSVQELHKRVEELEVIITK